MFGKCVCCEQGHKDVKAAEGDQWCRQCQKDGCLDPKLVEGETEEEAQEKELAEDVLQEVQREDAPKGDSNRVRSLAKRGRVAHLQISLHLLKDLLTLLDHMEIVDIIVDTWTDKARIIIFEIASERFENVAEDAKAPVMIGDYTRVQTKLEAAFKVGNTTYHSERTL